MGFYEFQAAYNSMSGQGAAMEGFWYEPHELEAIVNAIHASPALKGTRIEHEFTRMFNYAVHKKDWRGKASRIRID